MHASKHKASSNGQNCRDDNMERVDIVVARDSLTLYNNNRGLLLLLPIDDSEARKESPSL